MKNNPKYLVAVYKPEEFEISDIEKYNPCYCITVADIDKNIIVESVYNLYDKTTFEDDLESFVNDIYDDCTVIFNNQDISLLNLLREKYPSKILEVETMFNRKVKGWTPSKRLIDDFYFRQEGNILKESFGSLNYFLDKTRGL